MRAIDETAMREHIAKAGLGFEGFEGGTIRLDLAAGLAPRDIPVEAIPDVEASPFLIAYRESRSTSRYAAADSREDLVSFIATALRDASSVLDDVYIFPASGEFMLYVSHHDTLTIWERKPNRLTVTG